MIFDIVIIVLKAHPSHQSNSHSCGGQAEQKHHHKHQHQHHTTHNNKQ